MREFDITADELIRALLNLSAEGTVCILDSGGVHHLGSHLLIAGIMPIDVDEVSSEDADETLDFLDSKLAQNNQAAIFTLSYEFGAKLNSIAANCPALPNGEPDIFIAYFDCLVVHDYNSRTTFLTGDSERFDIIEKAIRDAVGAPATTANGTSTATSNFTRDTYIAAIENVKQKIRAGDTYQTNLTQQIKLKLADGNTPANIFTALRKRHPAPFGSFLKRRGSTVVSASPERFFKVTGTNITASPIKGTRRRGTTPAEDLDLRNELLASEKDRAENTMIVDLTRNDLGRICKYGSVNVEKLCEIEEHPTLFHLVSTVTGRLRDGTTFSEVIKALFPCGSITGAPKLSTMQIIAGIETAPRGLSMGSIGLNIPPGFQGLECSFEMNVAIRTMVVRENIAVFNVGGGIVIDSDPRSEYDESLLKAQALLAAAGAEFSGN